MKTILSTISTVCSLLAIALCLWTLGVRPVFSDYNFIRMLEAREGMAPGRTRVIPECGCTVRYLGTSVRGNIYSVRLEKLD